MRYSVDILYMNLQNDLHWIYHSDDMTGNNAKYPVHEFITNGSISYINCISNTWINMYVIKIRSLNRIQYMNLRQIVYINLQNMHKILLMIWLVTIQRILYMNLQEMTLYNIEYCIQCRKLSLYPVHESTKYA